VLPEAAVALAAISEHLQAALDVAAAVEGPAQAQVWAALARDLTHPRLVLNVSGKGVQERESFIRRVMRGRAAAYRRLCATGRSYAGVGALVGETKATVYQAIRRGEHQTD
jgi:hypothetical protein